VVLPAGIVPEQVTPGGKLTDAFDGQVRVMAPLNPPLGVTVMVEVVEDIVPAAPAVVVTVALLALIVKVPPEFTVIVKPGGVAFVSGPPPGWGVNRSIATPGAGTGVVKSESGNFTVSEVAEQAVMFDLTAALKRTTVGVAPPQMIDPPLTMSEKLVVPEATVVGLIVLIAGMGFKIVKGTPFVGLTCAGSVTVTVAEAPFTN
jgi:hypothetical protein